MANFEPVRATSQPSSSLYRSIVEEQIELICRRLPDGTITFVNEPYCRYYGLPREDLIGHKFMPLIPEEDRRKMDQISAQLSLDHPVVMYEHRTLSTHPEPRWLQWTKRAIYDEAGRLVELQHVGRDITRQKQIEDELRFCATHDALTGLFNSAFFETEIERLDPGRMAPLSIILCEVSGLPELIARKGQGAGDALLRQTAQVLRCAFRVEEILARIDENVFGVLLPNTPASAALQTVDRTAKCLEAERQLEGNPEIHFRLGAATATEAQQLEKTFRQARAELKEKSDRG